MYVPCRNDPRHMLLTREQILHFKPFHNAVIAGYLDQQFYTKLCSMALAYLDTIEELTQ